jgi:TonB family protein
VCRPTNGGVIRNMSRSTTRARALAWLFGLAAGHLGCLTVGGRGFPLYPQTEPLPDASHVARLSGYVRVVDGQVVSGHGNLFELLPGCHIVRTPTSWGTSGYGGAVVATTPELTFALPMRAGYQYEVAIVADAPTAPTEAIDVKAYERDPRGVLLQTFSYATSQRDLDRCESAAATASSAPEGPEAARADARTEVPGRPDPAPSSTQTISAGSAQPPSPPEWPNPPPGPSSARSLDEAMAHPDDLVAHWRRVPAYRSHFQRDAVPVSGPVAVDFARYVVKLQAKVQPAFADCSAQPWRAAGADQPRNLELELILDEAGALRDVGVIVSSGSDLIDAAALDAIARAAPFGATPAAARSGDGLTYLRWTLSSDPTYGCTLGARPHLER